MKQLGLSEPVFVKKPKPTERQKFLQETAQVIPWGLWTSRIAPHYPRASRGRRPFPLETMLRIHLMQQWFGYSDPAMEGSRLKRPFAIGRSAPRYPDAARVCRAGWR